MIAVKVQLPIYYLLADWGVVLSGLVFPELAALMITINQHIFMVQGCSPVLTLNLSELSRLNFINTLLAQ